MVGFLPARILQAPMVSDGGLNREFIYPVVIAVTAAGVELPS